MPNYPSDVNDTVVYNGSDLYLPKDCSLTVFEDSRLFLFGELYLNGQPILTGNSPPSGNEVQVGPAQPTDGGIKLWFDTSTGYGELKALVAGSWKTVEDPADATLGDEVSIGVGQPGTPNYELWVDTSVQPENLKAKISGSWKSINSEVAISGTEPTDPSVELWVDTATSAPIISTSYISAGNALGVVAVSSFKPTPVALTAQTYVAITNTLSYSLLTGRRYRVAILGRALVASGVAPQATFVRVDLRVNGTSFYSTSQPLKRADSSYDVLNYQWLIDGDGTTKLFDVALNVDQFGGTFHCEPQISWFYLEDLGPNQSPALPIPDTPQAWTAVAFQNGWVNIGGNKQTVQYRKIGDIVYLRGQMASGTIGAVAFTLPAGFRPPMFNYFVGDTYPGVNSHGVISVDTNGTVTPVTGSNTSWVLGDISFSVTP